MRRISAWSIAIVICVLVLFAVVSLQSAQSLPELTVDDGDPGRGAYLARASGCIACHTDIDGGGKPLAGGAPLKTDFGTFYAPNLTTDKEYGIGNWTLQQFAKALRQGVSPISGKAYYPAFPYSFYTKFSDQDVADLWAAFQTVPPVAALSKKQELTFPFSLREGLIVWQWLFFNQQRFTAISDDDEQLSRGEYLVEVAGHCAACHTRRNFIGGLDTDAWLAGADNPTDSGSVPAITASELNSAGWTQSDLSYALSTGIKPDGDVLGGSMGEVIRESTAFLVKDDLDAIAAYLLNEVK